MKPLWCPTLLKHNSLLYLYFDYQLSLLFTGSCRTIWLVSQGKKNKRGEGTERGLQPPRSFTYDLCDTCNCPDTVTLLIILLSDVINNSHWRDSCRCSSSCRYCYWYWSLNRCRSLYLWYWYSCWTRFHSCRCWGSRNWTRSYFCRHILLYFIQIRRCTEEFSTDRWKF